MKIGGVDPTTLPTEVFLVLPRGDDQQIVLRACPVASMDEFEALCPRPAPPGKMTRDGWVPMPEDPTYQQVMTEWSAKAARLHGRQVAGAESDRVGHSQPVRPEHLAELVHGPPRRRPERYRVPAGDDAGHGGQRPGRRQAEEGPRGFSCWGGSESRILWPPHRTTEYAVWCACERLGILPPGVKPAWDDCPVPDASSDRGLRSDPRLTTRLSGMLV